MIYSRNAWLRLWALVILLVLTGSMDAARRKVYMTFILHGNMNYDRYVRPTIWREFPVIYDNLMDFMDEHPDFKGQMQLSGQTMGSLQQAAPQVVEHALKIHRRGQLNFTGTFYSEPVNVNMDGETNYRCAWLGTQIVERITGDATDGFYLQERAYHPQLPYILNHAGVTWTPIITNDDSWRPFRLRGLDGSMSVCVPITRGDFIQRVRKAPAGSLIALEEDYEYPQTFTKAYETAARFNREQTDVEIEWITVKDYLHRFGMDGEKYVDHSAKARHRDHGTYSRWTADPLDIRVQEYTNKAMNDLRAAKIVHTLAEFCFGVEVDQPFKQADITLEHDPLVWNIERADLYPDIESTLLARNGQVTLLSKAEHLLLWGVNSDAKGWYPLYEKRRERVNAFRNSSLLSRHIIQRAADMLAAQLPTLNYDKYFLALNAEPTRPSLLTLHTDRPYELFECATGKPLRSVVTRQASGCLIEAEATLPSYGYMLIGARQRPQADRTEWHTGHTIESHGLRLDVDSGHAVLTTANGQRTDLMLDSFMLRPLAEITDGKGDTLWRQAKPYGPMRISVNTDGLYPQLRIERQPDWLVHLTETFTLAHGKVILDMNFDFPHPTLVRKQGMVRGNTFSPEGLNLLMRTHASGIVGYDLPYGISEYNQSGLSYFCPLSTLWLQHGKQGGLMVSPQSGEQAFSVDSDKGEIVLYMGASTTSGPIRNVGLVYQAKNHMWHEPAWYAETFHGPYHHRIVLQPYQGTWQTAHLPAAFRRQAQPVFVTECFPEGGSLQTTYSVIEVQEPNVEITIIDENRNRPFLRLNEREGRATQTHIRLGNQSYSVDLPAYGIRTLFL